jgi:golgi-specific brefeldin A-resistance guanine nucleotide exchange factor 1
MVVKPELPQPSPTNTSRSVANGPIYDPAIVYILELATILAIRDKSTVESFGKEVAEALQGVIRDAANSHHITVSRAAFYLLSLLQASHVITHSTSWSALH